MKSYFTIFVIAVLIRDCCSSQFLRDLVDNTVKPTKVISANCISISTENPSVTLEGEVAGTITPITVKDDMGVEFQPPTGAAVTSECTITAKGELTCSIAKQTTAVTYTIELKDDFPLKQDTSNPPETTEQLLKFKIENAVSFVNGAVIGVDATQTDKDKSVNYDDAKEEDLAFSIKFDTDLTATTIPKVKANTKELQCTVDATDAKLAKCTFTKEQLPLKDGEETKYEVTFVNACSTETATGITITVSNSAFVTFKVALMFLGLFLL